MAGAPENVAAMVVDGQYFYIMQRDNELDVLKVLEFIEGETGLEIQDRFWLDRQLNDQRKNFLRSADGPRFSVKEYPSKEKECPICHGRFQVQAGCDVGIALRIFRLCQTFRRIILLAGDGDFEEALEYARDYAHCDIILVSFKSNSSPKLHPYARRVIFLDVNDGRLKVQRMRADAAAESPYPWPPLGDSRPDACHKPRLLFDPGPNRPSTHSVKSPVPEPMQEPRHRGSPDTDPLAGAQTLPVDAAPLTRKADKGGRRSSNPNTPTALETAKSARPEKARGKQLKAWWAYTPASVAAAEEEEDTPKQDAISSRADTISNGERSAGRQSKRKSRAPEPAREPNTLESASRVMEPAETRSTAVPNGATETLTPPSRESIVKAMMAQASSREKQTTTKPQSQSNQIEITPNSSGGQVPKPAPRPVLFRPSDLGASPQEPLSKTVAPSPTFDKLLKLLQPPQ